MNLRTSIVLAALAAVASAHASFELLLVADATAKCVHRFDSQTGAYFGAFGVGRMNAVTSMCINQTTNSAYVLEGNRISSWNYNTGAFQGSYAALAGVTSIGYGGSGRLLEVAPRVTTLVNASNGGSLVVYNQPKTTMNFSSAVVLESGVTMFSTSADGSNNSFVQAASPGSTVLGDAISFPAFGGVTGLSSRASTFALVAPASNYAEFDFNTATYNGVTMTGLVGATSTAIGHDNQYYVAGKNAANTAQGIVLVVDGNGPGITRGTFGNNVLQNPVAMACVVAPEPSSVLVMVAAVGALAVRRPSIRRSKA